MRRASVARRAGEAARALIGKPLCNEAFRQKEARDTLSQIGWFDAREADWQTARALLKTRVDLPAYASGNVRWLLCQFAHPYGGVFTALRIADALQRRGFRNEILIYDDEGFDWQRFLPEIFAQFPALASARFASLGALESLEPSEFAVATFWPSAQTLLKMPGVQHKIYLIQDFEPAFYPAGTSYALAEMSYRMPFHRLVNTPGLMRYIADNYPQTDAQAHAFTPAADARYMRAPRPLKKPYRVLFYARPGTPRNAFELALAFAIALKSRYGEDVELVGAGEAPGDWESSTRGVISWAGVVAYDRLAEFYASFHFVVAFMLTKHPSYLPFEAMAAGCGVIANYNEANLWLLRDDVNCVLAQPTIPSLMDAFWRATKAENYGQITRGAEATIAAMDWERELQEIAVFFQSLRDGL